MSRRSVWVAVLGATLILGPRVRAGVYDRALLKDQTGEVPADVAEVPADRVERWLQECKTKGTPVACYNLAVVFVQAKGDEDKAVEYLRLACTNGHESGCSYLGGILIKDTATRKEGLALYQKACTLATAKLSPAARKSGVSNMACSIAKVVAKNMYADYTDIAEEAHIGAKARGASFDCAKASTGIEKKICGDGQASDLDFWVASYYRSAVQLSEQPERLKAEQRVWLTTQRNKCADVRCLRREYRQRFAQLRLLNAPAGTAHPKPPADDPYPASFVRPPFIRPTAVQQLTGSLMSDAGPQKVPVLEIDLANPKTARKFIGETKVTKGRDDDPIPYVHEDDPTDPRFQHTPGFGYRWRGRTTSGVDVLLVDESGGGSGVFECVLLVKVELDVSGGRNRLLLKKVRVQGLGDRWDGDLRVIGNNVLIGEDKGIQSDVDQDSGERLVIKVP